MHGNRKPPTPSTGTARQRLYRDRQKRGVEIATIEYSVNTLANLIDRHWLAPEQALDTGHVARVLGRIVEKWTVENLVDP